MIRAIRRLVFTLALSGFLVGLSAPIANANDKVCPFLKVSGQRYEICITLP